LLPSTTGSLLISTYFFGHGNLLLLFLSPTVDGCLLTKKNLLSRLLSSLPVLVLLLQLYPSPPVNCYFVLGSSLQLRVAVALCCSIIANSAAW